MTLYTYILTHDTGFAPNPYGGYCTLATCKPRIRARARSGVWVAAVGSAKAAGHDHLAYAMRVCAVLPIASYARDRRFAPKKPVLNGHPHLAHGDNLYVRQAGRWRRRPSPHHEDRKSMERDLRGKNVLVATEFYYFGRNAPKIPAQFAALLPQTQGDRCRFPDDLVTRFIDWLTGSFTPGIHGEPWHVATALPVIRSESATRATLAVCAAPRTGC